MTREELLAPILQSAPGVSATVFDDWDVIPGIEQGKHVCTAVMNGAEIHFAIHPEHQRKLIRRENTVGFLRPLFDRHGFLSTRVLLTQEGAQRFVERLGFEPTWSDHQFQYYLMNKLPFVRGHE